LFKAHYAQMHRLAKVLLHDDDLARDIVHNVFTFLLDGHADYPVSQAYLLRAVRNRCLNHIRDLGIRQRVMNRYFADFEEYGDEEWPDETTIVEIYAIIRHELPEQCQRAVELRFSYAMKIEEVSAEMGISKTMVCKHLRHALCLIRKKLRENG
ncbi:MAG: sigma-70 family RNA polymerase sigma factor, partial [Bacteroidales bacterium]|nr:sigma-70 family RNA polymerase sigma factor [Bacteroidales bacterium]